MTTLLQALIEGRQQLASESAELEARVLLAHVLRVSKTHTYTWPEQELTAAQWISYRALVDRRRFGEPIAYLVGEREFYGLPLAVDARVLIPRPETELLVDVALEMSSQTPLRVLDLGCGSGAIACAIAHNRPEWSVHGVDVSHEALAVAQHNKQALKIGNLQLSQSDWFSSLGETQFDLIVSNPPYVEPDSVWLQQGDVRFEPPLALTAKNAGMSDLEHIIAGASLFLSTSGWLWLEHGFEQAGAVRECLQQSGFQQIQSRQDLQGYERVTGGRWG
ncbi:MAG TPA: peptide chain release factor N(5)-glutamine methyltransferase [Halieaceae bacterium]|nr:peptide chain release factor N(5)-glutamine methyltransferase [Halieaceae bacterium]